MSLIFSLPLIGWTSLSEERFFPNYMGERNLRQGHRGERSMFTRPRQPLFPFSARPTASPRPRGSKGSVARSVVAPPAPGSVDTIGGMGREGYPKLVGQSIEEVVGGSPGEAEHLLLQGIDVGAALDQG